jgi:deoxyribodipyrimidine photo-lyase
MRAMIVSFATHVLRLSWRDILYPMARWMADYVPGIHVSQLQMQAALTGINTIRIYNPTKQLSDHDHDATFVRRWVPELTRFSPADIRELPATRCAGYYPPIVDYRTESKIAREYLYSIKRSDAGRAEADRVLERHGSRRRGR